MYLCTFMWISMHVCESIPWLLLLNCYSPYPLIHDFGLVITKKSMLSGQCAVGSSLFLPLQCWITSCCNYACILFHVASEVLMFANWLSYHSCHQTHFLFLTQDIIGPKLSQTYCVAKDSTEFLILLPQSFDDGRTDIYRLGLFNVEVWTLAWPTEFIFRAQWLVFPSFICSLTK